MDFLVVQKQVAHAQYNGNAFGGVLFSFLFRKPY